MRKKRLAFQRGARLLATAICMFAFVAGSVWAQQSDSVLAIKGAKIICVTRPTIDGGVVLVRNGKIETVAKNAKIPEGAEIIDATGKVIIPGLIDSLTMLAETSNDEESVTPDIKATDAFDFFGQYRKLLAGGVTTVYISPGRGRLIGGNGAVVKLAGDSPDKRTLKQYAGLSIILGESPKNPPTVFEPPVPPGPDNQVKPAKRQLPTTRMGEMSLLRNSFERARWERKHKPREIDSKTQALLDALDGKTAVRIDCRTAQDIRNALTLGKAFGLEIVLEGATEAYRMIDEIRVSKASVVLDAQFSPSLPTASDHTRDVAFGKSSIDNIAALSEARIPFAITASSDSATADLQFIAGCAVSRGLSPAKALEAVTIQAARILGVSNRVGSIERGRDADMVILSGSPFDLNCQVERTIVGGNTVYLKASDGDDVTADEPTLAIKAGKILTASRGHILNGLILVHGGKIAYAGKMKTIPKDATVIDAAKQVVIPGMIDMHSHLGLHADTPTVTTRPPSAASGASSSNTRFASIVEALTPGDDSFDEALQSGVTSILLSSETRGMVGGNSAVVKLAGDPFENRVVKEYAAVEFSMTDGYPRMALPWQARDMLKGAKSYAERWDVYERQYAEYLQKKARKKPDLVKPPTEPGRSTSMELLRGLFKREMPALVHVERADEIRNALKVFRDEFNLDVILLGASDGYRMVDELRKYGVGVAAGPSLIVYNKFEKVNYAAILANKGLRVAIHTSASSNTQQLPLSAAYAIRSGMQAEEAFKAVTITPARLLHVEDRIGSIDVGKDADLVVLSGEPFEFDTKVETVIVSGQAVYGRNAK